jgi:hypothetical protein
VMTAVPPSAVVDTLLTRSVVPGGPWSFASTSTITGVPFEVEATSSSASTVFSGASTNNVAVKLLFASSRSPIAFVGSTIAHAWCVPATACQTSCVSIVSDPWRSRPPACEADATTASSIAKSTPIVPAVPVLPSFTTVARNSSSSPSWTVACPQFAPRSALLSSASTTRSGAAPALCPSAAPAPQTTVAATLVQNVRLSIMASPPAATRRCCRFGQGV